VARLFGVDEHDVIALLAPGLSLRSFGELQRLVPNVVACPVAFDFPCRRPDNFHYIDALVDAERDRGAPFDWSRVSQGSRVIYLSIGTQGWVMREATRFLRVVVEAVARRPDWHLVLSAGRFIAPEALAPLPRNVEVHARVPQIQVLGRASLMITHAGLNSIKECILSGVPMLAFPAGRDQPGNAARVHYHGLGRRADYRRIGADEVGALIDEVIGDPAYLTRVAAMRERFLAAEREDAAWRVIEGELSAPA
jgi:MGT family glycosyltransferase